LENKTDERVEDAADVGSLRQANEDRQIVVG
jgi:hypothetical protein